MTNLRNNNRQIARRIWRKCEQLFLDSINSFEKRSFWYSVLLHLLLVTALVIIGEYIQTRYNKPQPTLILTNQQNQTPIINAKVITSDTVETIQKPVQKTQQKLTLQQQKELQSIEQKIAKAKQLALKEFDATKMAEQKKQEALRKQAEIEKQKQHETESKEKQEQETKLAKEQALEKQRQKHERDLQKQQALKVLQQSVLSDLNRQNQAALEQAATQVALENYAAEYKKRIESAWIMDDCHGINPKQLPTVLVIPNQAPSVVVSSGSTECDHSLLLAFRNTQAPNLPADAGAKKIIQQGINFQFGALAK